LHRDSWALIPWYVNSRINDRDRKRVDAHLGTCAACRNELQHQQRIFQAMAGEASIEQMPTASLRRFKQQLAIVKHETVASGVCQISAPARGSLQWQGLLAASLAAVAIALGAVAYSLRPQQSRHAAAAPYYTVTAQAPRAPNAAIRAVFSPELTVSQLQDLLNESRLTIVAGPSEAGVYSLGPSSNQSVRASLSILRRHAAVRFAESTGAGQPRGTTQ
jgi:anti-sigma factor RsiW